MIDRNTIDKIMAATNIVDVVGEFVTLRKSGANYKGLCPFHNEKTPSFIVSPSRGTCHCFGCNKGGNAVSFLMEHEQMTYPEALRWLASKYHIEIVEKELTSEEKQEASKRESMYILNEWAMKYFQDILYNDDEGKSVGMAYFRSRGFRDDIIKKFCLGYSLSSKDALAKEALKKGYKEEFLLSTGLCYKQENNNRLHDRYYGRVIFPWFSISGKVNAFGGRLLDSRTKGVSQKYVNSPESEIYHKSNELYGLYQGKKAIVMEDVVYMVEGYTDVISMHQCGIENVVANSGTALSFQQIRSLQRFTSNIVLIYDGDAAGQHAAIRGTDMLLSEGMNIRIVLLPESEDPDSFARKHTVDEFKTYIESHKTDFIVFKIRLMLEGVTDPIQRSEAISNIVKSISVIRDPIKRATYIHECSQRTGMHERALINTMNRFIHSEIEEREKRRDSFYSQNEGEISKTTMSEQPAIKVETKTMSAEDLIIQQIIRYGDVVIYKDIDNGDGTKISLNLAQYVQFDLSNDNIKFRNELYNKILTLAIVESGNSDFHTESFFVNYPDLQISKLAAEMSINKYHLSNQPDIKEEKAEEKEKKFEDELRSRISHLMMDLKMEYFQSRINELQQKLKTMEKADFQSQMKAMAQLKQYQQNRNILAKELGINIKK